MADSSIAETDLFRSFAERFGEDQAAAVMEAGLGHRDDPDRRSFDPEQPDEFATALAFAISYECVSKYRTEHGITADVDLVKQWANETRALAHATDADFLGVMVGAYEDWMPPPDSASPDTSQPYPFSPARAAEGTIAAIDTILRAGDA